MDVGQAADSGCRVKASLFCKNNAASELKQDRRVDSWISQSGSHF